MKQPDHTQGEHLWLAVHTKPRQELIAEEHLARQGFRCFLPRAYNPQRRLKRERPRVEAMFPRYLFIEVIVGEQDIAPVNSTRGVARIVRFGNQLVKVPEWVVTKLQAMADGVTGLIQLNPLSFRQGEAVEVFEGPLAGLQAIFQQLDGERRAVLLMNLLGREQRVTVPATSLRYAG